MRLTGEWEAWLACFAEAIIVTATQAVETAQQLLDLSSQDRNKISGLGRAAASTLRVHRALMEHPIAKTIAEHFNVGRMTSSRGIEAAPVCIVTNEPNAKPRPKSAGKKP